MDELQARANEVYAAERAEDDADVPFEINGQHYTAAVWKDGEPSWPRSTVGPDHYTTRHNDTDYVIHLLPSGFLAYAIDEAR